MCLVKYIRFSKYKIHEIFYFNEKISTIKCEHHLILMLCLLEIWKNESFKEAGGKNQTSELKYNWTPSNFQFDQSLSQQRPKKLYALNNFEVKFVIYGTLKEMTNLLWFFSLFCESWCKNLGKYKIYFFSFGNGALFRLPTDPLIIKSCLAAHHH